MSDDDWALYAEHRAHFTDAIASCAHGGSGRLCVLGAGLCNDVDLERLAQIFSEVHLVDIAPKTLARAVARQPADVRARLYRHAPVDLSAFSHRRLQKWKKFPPTPVEVTTAAASALPTIAAQLPGPFDVVASACVLTQMSFDLRAALGESHHMLAPIRLALVVTHLSTLVEFTTSGGACLFASDAVSSSHSPLESLGPARNLRNVLSTVFKSGACYFAGNPDVIRTHLEQVGRPELLDPWLWQGAFGRTYLVYALRLAIS